MFSLKYMHKTAIYHLWLDTKCCDSLRKTMLRLFQIWPSTQKPSVLKVYSLQGFQLSWRCGNKPSLYCNIHWIKYTGNHRPHTTQIQNWNLSVKSTIEASRKHVRLQLVLEVLSWFCPFTKKGLFKIERELFLYAAYFISRST